LFTTSLPAPLVKFACSGVSCPRFPLQAVSLGPSIVFVLVCEPRHPLLLIWSLLFSPLTTLFYNVARRFFFSPEPKNPHWGKHLFFSVLSSPPQNVAKCILFQQRLPHLLLSSFCGLPLWSFFPTRFLSLLFFFTNALSSPHLSFPPVLPFLSRACSDFYDTAVLCVPLSPVYFFLRRSPTLRLPLPFLARVPLYHWETVRSLSIPHVPTHYVFPVRGSPDSPPIELCFQARNHFDSLSIFFQFTWRTPPLPLFYFPFPPQGGIEVFSCWFDHFSSLFGAFCYNFLSFNRFPWDEVSI